MSLKILLKKVVFFVKSIKFYQIGDKPDVDNCGRYHLSIKEGRARCHMYIWARGPLKGKMGGYLVG